MEPTQQPPQPQQYPPAPQKPNYMIPISIVLAGALIATGIYLGGMRSGVNTQTGNQQEANGGDLQLASVNKDDHILGNPNAKIVIVEYSDLECPFCKAYQATLHQIIDKYGKNGDVAWVYRHFPLTELHSKASKEAEASECAAELGGSDKFFQYIDAVYAITPSNDGLDLAQLPVIAGQVGLDVNAFSACLNSGKYANKVAAARSEAIAAGGQGTPYTILVTSDGTKLPITQGAISFTQLSGLIDELLASK